MFKNRSKIQTQQTIELLGVLAAFAEASASSKGRGAERMEAMAQVVVALGFDAQSIESVEVDWKVIDGEYLPTIKINSKTNSKEIVQIEQKSWVAGRQ